MRKVLYLSLATLGLASLAATAVGFASSDECPPCPACPGKTNVMTAYSQTVQDMATPKAAAKVECPGTCNNPHCSY